VGFSGKKLHIYVHRQDILNCYWPYEIDDVTLHLMHRGNFPPLIYVWCVVIRVLLILHLQKLVQDLHKVTVRPVKKGLAESGPCQCPAADP
jgi:hypothetical protein